MIQNDLVLRIIEKIKTGYNPDKLIVFGSYAWGNPGSGSDIDLFIIKRTDKSHRERSREVRKLLKEENRELGLEILVFTPEEIKAKIDTEDSFISLILNKGEVVYG